MKVDVSNLFKDAKKLQERLSKESDVGGVLISTSFLENCLASLLRVHFAKSKVTDKLLNPTSGTLGTFSSKCDVAYCLNLILKETYQDLGFIGQTRNHFAHNHLKASFNDDYVREICCKLKAPNDYLEANQNQSNYEDVKELFQIPKKRFIYTVNSLREHLMIETLSIESRNPEL